MDFVAAFIADPSTAATIAGVTKTVLAAAEEAVKSVTVDAFKLVWITNAAIGIVTTFCEI